MTLHLLLLLSVALSVAANTPKPYLEVSRKLGNVLADGGHMTVNGAGKVCIYPCRPNRCQ